MLYCFILLRCYVFNMYLIKPLFIGVKWSNFELVYIKKTIATTNSLKHLHVLDFTLLITQLAFQQKNTGNCGLII